MNGTLVFGSPTGLWQTNGTTSRTSLVTPTPFYPSATANGYLFGTLGISYSGSLYSSDGTAAGTLPVINGALTGDGPINQPEIIAVGTTLFLMSSVENSPLGYSLYAVYGPGPTVATAASASPNPTAGTTTALSVLGADPAGESSLTYTWSTIGTPPAGVLFASNGTNDAKNTSATFAMAGVCQFSCLITDAVGLTVSSSVTVTVSQALTSIAVSAAPTSQAQYQQFIATGFDQFNQPMAVQPTVIWSVSGGGTGTISSSGFYASNGGIGGPYTVTATSGSIAGTAYLTTTTTNIVTISGNTILGLGAQGTIVVTLTGAAGSQTITLTNGATFSDGTTSKTQVGPSSVSYTILGGPAAGGFSVNVDGNPVDSGEDVEVTISDLPDRTTDPNHPCPPGIPTGIPTPITVTVSGLPPNGSVTVNLSVSGVTRAGNATVNPAALTTNGTFTVMVTGTAQSSPAGTFNFGPPALNWVQATLGKSSAVIAENHTLFSICNHPKTIKINLPSGVTWLYPAFYGADLQQQFLSDGNPDGSTDGNNQLLWVKVIERLPNSVQVSDPFLPNPLGFKIQTTPFALGTNIETDHKFITLQNVRYGSLNQGKLITNQCQSFTCAHCGGTDISVPKGGLVIEYDVNPATNGSGGNPQTVQQKHYPPQGTITYSNGKDTWTCNPGQGTVTSPVWPARP